jgi:aryl-alcohol dehydrogenase-like predicted oxidoreductase
MNNYRKIGNSDLKLSTVTFGAWAAGGWMWGGSEPKAAIEAMKASIGAGVTSFDTAPAYGQGLSEELVGEAIKGVPRDTVQILTKYGLRWEMKKGEFYFASKNNSGKTIDMYRYAGKESVIEECENSLRRLKTEYIDLYQIHWSDPTTPIEETMEAVSLLIQQGKVRYAGVCNYTVDKIDQADKSVHIISNQVPYSMLRRDIEEKTVPYCISKGKGILAYSPLQRGLLTGKFTPGHSFNDGDTRAEDKHYTEQNIRKVNRCLGEMQPLAEGKNISLTQLVIRWTLEQPGITVTLVGARNKEQALHNAKAMGIQLSEDEKAFIAEKLDELEIM